MKTITKKSLISLLITLIMILNLVPFGAISKVYATTTINNINILGVEKPVSGNKPVTASITTDTPGITLNLIQWQNYSSSSIIPNSNRFESGKRYGLYITFQVEEGYELAQDATVTANEEYEELDNRFPNFIYIIYNIPDERTTITEVEATANIKDVYAIGAPIFTPEFTVTKGTELTFAPYSWFTKNGENWDIATGSKFAKGTYRYRAQVSVDGDNRYTHKIDQNAKVTINGIDWRVIYGAEGYGVLRTYIYIESPDIIVRNSNIILDANGGTGSGFVPVSNYGDDWIVDLRGVTAPPCHEFAGWKVGDEIYQVGDTYSNITEDITAVAQWNPIPHTPKDAVRENEIAATCTSEGSYDEVVYCSVCGEEISRTPKTIAKKEHNYKSTIIPATFNKDGTITEKCTICGHTKPATVIPSIKTVELSKTDFTYNKKIQKPSVVVKDSKGKVLKNGIDYTVTYSNKNSKKIGSYKVIVTFKGNYKGSKELKYQINPKGTSLVRLGKGSERFRVVWKAQKTETTGYEIQYSTNKKFKSGNKKTTIKKNKTTSTIIMKVKGLKKYYVRIRTYKTVNGKKFCSGWSKALNVKTMR